MAYKKVGLDYLSNFLPDNAFSWIKPYLKLYKIDLKITPERQSKLGDYMFHPQENRHKISINGTLNKYEFFFTFIHELAHLITFVHYEYRVEAHGKEWKSIFKTLLQDSIHYFPNSLQKMILQHFEKMKSAQCFDTKLYLEFKKYDEKKRLYIHMLQPGDIFTIKSGEKFLLINKRRTRYLCENISTKKQYLFPALYEITSFQNGSTP